MGSVRRSIMSKPMTKTQLVAALADEMGSDKKSAGAAFDAVCITITREVSGVALLPFLGLENPMPCASRKKVRNPLPESSL